MKSLLPSSASLTLEAFLSVVDGLGASPTTYTDAALALLGEGYGAIEIALYMDEVIQIGAVEAVPPTMESLGYGHEDIIRLLEDGADLDHLGLFRDGSHFEDLFDQSDGLNSTGSGLY